MGDQHKIRASDRDRQQAVEQLRGALEDGRLTMGEYVDRMEAAYQAATYGDLAPLCADLPAPIPVIAGPQTAAAATAPLAGSSRAGCLGLGSRMGDATFQQAWAQGAAMGRQRAVEYALQH